MAVRFALPPRRAARTVASDSSVTHVSDRWSRRSGKAVEDVLLGNADARFNGLADCEGGGYGAGQHAARPAYFCLQARRFEPKIRATRLQKKVDRVLSSPRMAALCQHSGPYHP